MKILVIRFSSIGDIVLTTPVVRCIKNQIPDSEIHYATKTDYHSLLENNPDINRIHLLEESNLHKLIKELRQEKFDFVVDLHRNIRTFLIKTKLLRPSATFHKLNLEKYLLVNFHLDRLPDTHIVNRYFEAVKKLGVTNDGKGLDYYFPENFEVNHVKKFGIPETGFVVAGLGGKFFTKKYPVPSWIEAINASGKPFVLLGGQDETEEANQIAARTNAHNLVGKTSLHESAWIIKNAHKVITHDTGLMHIAAAFRKEIISLWGNTVTAFGMYPYYGNEDVKSVILEVSGLKCRPCSKLGHKKCPEGHFDCMNRIEPRLIVEAIG